MSRERSDPRRELTTSLRVDGSGWVGWPPVWRSRSEHEAWKSTSWSAAQAALGRLIAARQTAPEPFTVPGICSIDMQPVLFEVDYQWGATCEGDVHVPNYRERLVCPTCGLNCRQRALATLALRYIGEASSRDLAVHVAERVTPFFRVLDERSGDGCRVHGSEYLGADHSSGEEVGGVRHEDVCHLSFGDESLDLMISGDVLEHVANPEDAFREASRCLRGGGAFLFTIPFHSDRDASSRRAVLTGNGRIVHDLPPEYHGNPLGDGRSLVFTDFGWDVLDMARRAGFADAAALGYWDAGFGFLDDLGTVFVASKGSGDLP